MKKLIIIAVLLFAAFSANAQIAVGGAVQYGYAFENHKHNVGADIRCTYKFTDLVKARAVLDVNGFVPNGYDRYAKGMLGLSFGLPYIYGFADFGGNFNPSSKKNVIGFAADAGIGTGYEHNGWHWFCECGADVSQNGKHWRNNFACKIGVTYRIDL